MNTRTGFEIGIEIQVRIVKCDRLNFKDCQWCHTFETQEEQLALISMCSHLLRCHQLQMVCLPIL